MLMLPATKTRPILLLKDCLIPKFFLTPDLKFLFDRFDIGKRRQSCLVTEALDLVGRGSPRKLEMILPAFGGIAEVGIDIGAVEHVTGAVGVEHALARDRQRGHGTNRAGLVIPEQAAFAHGDAADPAAAALEVVQQDRKSVV